MELWMVLTVAVEKRNLKENPSNDNTVVCECDDTSIILIAVALLQWILNQFFSLQKTRASDLFVFNRRWW